MQGAQTQIEGFNVTTNSIDLIARNALTADALYSKSEFLNRFEFRSYSNDRTSLKSSLKTDIFDHIL